MLVGAANTVLDSLVEAAWAPSLSEVAPHSSLPTVKSCRRLLSQAPSSLSTTNTNQPSAHVHGAETDLLYEARPHGS